MAKIEWPHLAPDEGFQLREKVQTLGAHKKARLAVRIGMCVTRARRGGHIILITGPMYIGALLLPGLTLRRVKASSSGE